MVAAYSTSALVHWAEADQVEVDQFDVLQVEVDQVDVLHVEVDQVDVLHVVPG